MKLNHEMDPNNLKEGQTILVPAGALSERDREIIQGVDRGAWRTYPVRKGEALSDILEKRKISMDEFQKLNPDILPTEIKGTALSLPCRTFYLCRTYKTHVLSCKALLKDVHTIHLNKPSPPPQYAKCRSNVPPAADSAQSCVISSVRSSL